MPRTNLLWAGAGESPCRSRCVPCPRQRERSARRPSARNGNWRPSPSVSRRPRELAHGTRRCPCPHTRHNGVWVAHRCGSTGSWMALARRSLGRQLNRDCGLRTRPAPPVGARNPSMGASELCGPRGLGRPCGPSPRDEEPASRPQVCLRRPGPVRWRALGSAPRAVAASRRAQPEHRRGWGEDDVWHRRGERQRRGVGEGGRGRPTDRPGLAGGGDPCHGVPMIGSASPIAASPAHRYGRFAGSSGLLR